MKKLQTSSVRSGKVVTRRGLLKEAAVTTVAVAVATASKRLGFPYIGNADAAQTTTWPIQTSWPGGIRLKLFKDWCS